MPKDKKGFLYRFFYGKDKSDFKEESLLKNRKEVFFHIYQDHFRLNILISLTIALFFLPLIFWLHIKNVYILSSSNGVYEATRIFTINLIGSILSIPLIMLASLGCSGIFYVARRLVWGEGIMLRQDFFIGLKKSWPKYLLMGFIISISLMIVTINISFFQLKLEISTLIKTIVLFFSVIQFIIVFTLTMFVFTQEAIYDQKFKQTIKNGLIFTFAKLPTNLLVMVATLFPIIVIVNLPNLLYQSFGLITYFLFGFSFLIITWTLYSHHIFDKYINSKYCMEIYDKGIWRKK